MADQDDQLPAESAPQGEAPAPFPVVGIGASAGGLEALEKLFGAMPPDSGMAFVVIQHLDPTRQSHMVELLGRRTQMDVVAVRKAAPVRPNCVYMILPNREVTIRNGVLHLAERLSGGAHGGRSTLSLPRSPTTGKSGRSASSCPAPAAMARPASGRSRARAV